MNDDRIARVARRLLDARRARRAVPVPPLEDPPASAETAYAIQDAVLAEIGPRGGWKVGAAGAGAVPVCAPLPAALIFAAPATLPAADYGLLGIEAEVAFRLGADLPPRDRDYNREEVIPALAAAMPAIEVVNSRWHGWPRVDRMWQLADLQSNGALVFGHGRTDWDEIDLSIEPVRLTVDGRTVAEAIGGNPAGDPLDLVTWLANHAAKRAGGLKAGEIVTTGSCTGMNFAAAGATVTASFPALGEAAVTFAA